MINLRCDACDKTVDITTIEPKIVLHPTESDHGVLPYSLTVRCPECDHVLGWNWAMVRTHYEWKWSEAVERETQLALESMDNL